MAKPFGFDYLRWYLGVKKRIDNAASLPGDEKVKALIVLHRRYHGLMDDEILQKLAWTGEPSSLPYLKPYFDKWPRSWILRGWINKARCEQVNETWRSEVFAFLKPMLFKKSAADTFSSGSIPGALWALDRERALELFRNEHFLLPGSPHLCDLMKTMDREDELFSHEIVDILVRQYDPGNFRSHEAGREYLQAVRMLGRYDLARADRLLWNLIEPVQLHVSEESVLEELLDLHSLPWPAFGLDDKRRKQGLDALSGPEWVVFLSRYFGYRLDLDGTYTVLMGDEEPELMMQALEQLGAVRTTKLIRDTLARLPSGFGRLPLSERENFIYSLENEALHEILEPPIAQWRSENGHEEELYIMALRYELAHADSFDRNE